MAIRLLVVGASNKSTRSIAKSLKKKGVECYVLHDVDLAVSKSKYLTGYILNPELQHDIIAYKNEIISVVKFYKIDVLLPTTDVAIEVTMRFRKELESIVNIIGLNSPDAYKYAHNKYELVKLADEHELKTPEYLYIDNIDFPESDLKKLSFPRVVKPVSSAKIAGTKYYGYKVRIAESYEQLVNILREVVLNTPVMVQEYIEGYGIGFNIFCLNGEVKSEYIHRRINENQGVSSYRKIESVTTYGIRNRIHKMIKEVGWNGIAMIEFKVDNKGVPYLMEMNGRFFGSTELGVKAGYDFPLFLYSTQFLKNPELKTNTGKFYSLRFLHDEVLLEYHKLLTSKNILRFLKWKLSLLNTLVPGNFFEDNFFDDPRFVFNLYKYDYLRWKRKKNKRKKIQQIQLKPITKDLVSSAKKIAFICYGNICRSPFAAICAERFWEGKRIHSAGFYELPQRLSPLNAIKAATKLGYDLSTHRSCHLNDLETKSIDLFIVMDKNNFQSLVDMGIDFKKIYFLADDEITDPYGKDLNEFTIVYKQIEQTIKRTHQ